LLRIHCTAQLHDFDSLQLKVKIPKNTSFLNFFGFHFPGTLKF
jgi:hypothetical protein